MFDSLRLFVLSVLYYFGFIYAAFTAVKQRSTTVVMGGQSALSHTTENGRLPSIKVQIGVPALKLMIMLTIMALLSLVGADWFPLFLEMRVICMYSLLYSPPYAQQELYDQLFAPLLVRGGTFALSPRTRDIVARTVSLFVARRCVDVAIAAMDYTECCRILGADAARDIMISLQFSQRALKKAADVTRESERAMYAQTTRDRSVAADIFTPHAQRNLVPRDAREDFCPRIPLGRVVRGDHVDPESSLPVATASLPLMPSISNTARSELVGGLYKGQSHSGLDVSEDDRTDQLYRRYRHRKTLSEI